MSNDGLIIKYMDLSHIHLAVHVVNWAEAPSVASFYVAALVG